VPSVVPAHPGICTWPPGLWVLITDVGSPAHCGLAYFFCVMCVKP